MYEVKSIQRITVEVTHLIENADSTSDAERQAQERGVSESDEFTILKDDTYWLNTESIVQID